MHEIFVRAMCTLDALRIYNFTAIFYTQSDHQALLNFWVECNQLIIFVFLDETGTDKGVI